MTGYCGGKTRSGTSCRRPAGWGTDHPGEGKCKLHGGSATGRPIIHGRYSVKHRAALAEKVAQFLDDPAPGDLSHELALTRALLQDYLDRFGDGQPLPYEDMSRILDIVESVGRMVERISRILNSTALTQVEVQYLQARLADLIVKYIDDPNKRFAFMDELGASFRVRSGSAAIPARLNSE